MLLTETIDINGSFPRLSRRLRLGVIGGGRISKTQAMAARMTDRWEIVAGAFSSNPDKAKQASIEWHLPTDRCYASFEDLAEHESRRDDGVDAVMITTPNHVHFAAAEACLKSGIAVLCDKPLTTEISEAETLVALANTSDCVFGVSYVMSCFPMIRQAREIIAAGGIGKINQIHAEFMQDWMTPEEVASAPHVQWRLDPNKSGRTSCVGDIGTHAAHLASFTSLLPLTDIRADFHVCGAPKLLEDTFFASTKYNHDIPGTLMATRLAPGNRGGLRLRIFGSEGGLEWNLERCDQLKYNRFGHADQILSKGHGHSISPYVERLVNAARGFPEGIIEAWGNLYTEFAMAVAAKKDGIALPESWLGMPTVADGAKGVAFIEACVRSHEAGGQWVSL